MNKEQLIFYHRDYCAFCGRVDAVINKLGIELERRNIWEDDDIYDELEAATGRGTVPVLRIVDVDGESIWMPESDDIVEYLIDRFGKPQD